MMILSKNKGISNYYEICDIELSGNYEEKMLINNHFTYLPEAEIRSLDNQKSLYVKVDGFTSLSNKYGRCVPDVNNVIDLVRDISKCIKEVREYLLSPSNLILNTRYILYDEKNNTHSFIYVPDNPRDFREQIKLLFEEIMRVFDHKNREGVVFLYDIYSKILTDNFTPELFCKVADEIEEKSDMTSAYENDDVRDAGDRTVNKYTTASERDDMKDRMFEIDMDDYKKESKKTEADESHSSRSLYILSAAAAFVTSIVLYIFFGQASLKFSSVIFAALIIYVIVDRFRKGNMEADNVELFDSEAVDIASSDDWRIKQTESKQEINQEIVFEEDTSVLAQNYKTDGVSRLIPCQDGGAGQIYLIEGETKVGRQTSSCDYCINEPSISRVHAILEKIGNKVMVRDAGSTNGTYINETRLEVNHPVEAVYGDMISFAGVQYECR